MGFEGVLGILLIAGILWVIIQFINKNRSNNLFTLSQQESSVNDENAKVILKKRFTSGEISQLEYERMKKDLS